MKRNMIDKKTGEVLSFTKTDLRRMRDAMSSAERRVSYSEAKRVLARTY